jgi:hypothetical protein
MNLSINCTELEGRGIRWKVNLATEMAITARILGADTTSLRIPKNL